MSPGFTPRPSLSGVRVERDGPAPAVSPRFTPRPSLSGLAVRAVRPRRARVAAVQAPAFVERRSTRSTTAPCSSSVAGVHAPAFVERRSTTAPTPTPCRVAGVHAPAFVERRDPRRTSQQHEGVSPGFTPRPSLSAGSGWYDCAERGRVSPGFTPRPSLSGGHPVESAEDREVSSPGFTPRPSLSGPAVAGARPGPGVVAGVHAPVFVERT